MTNWSPQMLNIFQQAETLVIMPYNNDGKTFEEISPLSPVVYGDSLYVRGWKGKATRWYLAACDQPAGFIELYGHRFPVTFEKATQGDDFNDNLSDAFWDKYKDSKTAAPHALVSGPGVDATLRILPRVDEKGKLAMA